MSYALAFSQAHLVGMALAKVGNPLRDEPLQTSKQLCEFDEDESELLTATFLKSFKSLERQQFFHHSDLSSNEVYSYVDGVFSDPHTLVDNGAMIAKHLYAQSKHPQIKSGDLCVSYLDGVLVDGEPTQAVCIIKSESLVPFLQIAFDGDDLKLKTLDGIYPEKLDKGCLIVNRDKEEGYAVYVFDKSGGSTHFWVRDFLGVQAVKDASFLTKRYSELCVAFAEKGLPEDTDPEQRREVATKAVSQISEVDEFDLNEFQEKTFDKPEVRQQFSEFKKNFEEEVGSKLDEKFAVVKDEAKKVEKKLKSRLKLDSGADIRFSAPFLKKKDEFFEKGFDEERGLQYVKIYYDREKPV
ncbi:nucleoid-associated protein [Sulfuriroseicoccus oceanibius]|uniref:Nucleoid-associated protein n=1 Tax=Sulfuriroseicoccus oceanibius TaxID=2707525 RepID=A0A6B3LCD1_9BACT|nr:nucleoid-associated protein [Sulfuriroseicoccus oceanibius]QQL45303.1 nucleoid-associated protein [Sulfuriroseicoccus oceanibius]